MNTSTDTKQHHAAHGDWGTATSATLHCLTGCGSARSWGW